EAPVIARKFRRMGVMPKPGEVGRRPFVPRPPALRIPVGVGRLLQRRGHPDRPGDIASGYEDGARVRAVGAVGAIRAVRAVRWSNATFHRTPSFMAAARAPRTDISWAG